MPRSVNANGRICSVVQAAVIQRLCHDVTVALRMDLKSARSAKSRAQVARALRDAVSAWDIARDAVRILRGKGLPTKVPEKPSRRQLRATKAWNVVALDQPETGKQVAGLIADQEADPCKSSSNSQAKPQPPSQQNSGG